MYSLTCAYLLVVLKIQNVYVISVPKNKINEWNIVIFRLDNNGTAA